MIESNIIKLASDDRYNSLRNKYTHKTEIKNKTCGDKIKIEIIVKKNLIKSMRYETESCVYCQASASLLSSKINLFKLKEYKSNISILKKSFREKKNNLPKKFKIFYPLTNPSNYKRLSCIMLPFDALKKALEV